LCRTEGNYENRLAYAFSHSQPHSAKKFIEQTLHAKKKSKHIQKFITHTTASPSPIHTSPSKSSPNAQPAPSDHHDSHLTLRLTPRTHAYLRSTLRHTHTHTPKTINPLPLPTQPVSRVAPRVVGSKLAHPMSHVPFPSCLMREPRTRVCMSKNQDYKPRGAVWIPRK
jgi:hypothetical protein